TVSDGKGGVTTYTVTILVTPVNDAPVATNDKGSVRPGSSVTVPVLGNDTDIDGDKLTVKSATAGQGSVTILADGSISYTPRPGFAGTDTITYVISDGHGGFATATVTIEVQDSGYVEQPVEFGFNGPSILPDNDNSASDGDYASISADGAVVDAVFDIGSLRSLAGQLGTDGIVLSAANGVRSLGGMGSLGANGIILETIRAERAREMLSYAGLDFRVFGGGIDGLTGFSLRSNVPGNLGSLGSEEQVIIESLVRNRTLIVQISNTIDPGEKRIVDYKITQADGTPLPEWLDRAGRDLLIGERSANEEIIKIRVEAIYSDGTVVVQEVKIETATGEIQPLTPGKQGSLAPALFGDQFNARPMLTTDQIQSLGRAIAR
ncbi:MAG: Ig-like domain-containing protein, partial [Aestuariivirga sp.]